MCRDDNGGGNNSHGGDDEANSRTGGGSPEKGKFGARFSKAAIELVLEVGEGGPHVGEIRGIRGRERVVLAIEFEEDIEGVVAL